MLHQNPVTSYYSYLHYDSVLSKGRSEPDCIMFFGNTITEIMSCQTDGLVIHCLNPLFISILFIVLLLIQNIYERTGKNSEKDKADVKWRVSSTGRRVKHVGWTHRVFHWIGKLKISEKSGKEMPYWIFGLCDTEIFDSSQEVAVLWDSTPCYI